MNLKKQLQTVNDKIKALAKTVDKMISVIDKPEKVKQVVPKAQQAKKVVVKKKAVKQPAAKQPAVKQTAVKQPAVVKEAIKEVVKVSAKGTAADAVFAVIKESNKGVNTASLMERTGFNEKKIQNIVFKLKKQGKIKSVDKGVYVTA